MVAGRPALGGARSRPVRADLPTGTVTLLFTDIEGSTRLLGELGPDAYEHALASHRAVLRAAFEAHDGVEVDTQGDGFFVAFAGAADALSAASQLTAALGDGPIRVRVGIHTGEPRLASEGYVGMDVHRAARIAAAGHGGQVLVSLATRDLVPELELLDLGEHRLKDLVYPERLFQLGQHAFPALKSLNRTNLPLVSWPLLGRERELAELEALITAGQRLVTLTGPGGSGKTRLALQVAADLSDSFVDGTFFVALAPAKRADSVPGAIAVAVGLQADDDIFEALSGRRMLLLLDNAEHLAGVEAVVNELLTAAREVVVLVTSRAPLHLAAEQEFRVEPLEARAARALFVARAAALDRQIEDDERVGLICERLDNLPLAVELAAARTSAIPPEALLTRLDHALPVLTGGPRDAPERQRTLRATIEWSYDLLGDEERRVFRTLAIFRGGFSLEAAEDVAGGDLDTLGTLVDQSLLKTSVSGRFFMLETLREFALDLLTETGEAPSASAAHADWYLDQLQKLRPLPRTRELLAWYDAETPNTRAALEVLIETDPERALTLADHLASYWHARGQLKEGRVLLEQALAKGSAPSVPLARATAAYSRVCLVLGDLGEAERAADDAIRLAHRVADDLTLSCALHDLAAMAYRRGNAAHAAELALQAIDAAQRTDEWGAVANGLNVLGLALTHTSDFEGAEQCFRRIVDLGREHDSRSQVMAEMNLGVLAFSAGRHGEAREWARSAADAARALDHLPNLVGALLNLALASVAEGDDAEATQSAVEALKLARQYGFSVDAVYCAWVIAVAARTSEPLAASQLWAAAEAAMERLGRAFDPFEHATLESLMTSTAASLGADEYARALAQGRELNNEETVALALQLANHSAVSVY